MAGPPPPLEGRARPGLRLFVVAAALALALATAGGFLAWRNHESERERVLDETGLLARAAAAEADQFLRSRIDLLNAVAVAPAVRSADPAAMRPYFALLPGAHPSLSDVAWIDTQGVVRVTTPPDVSGAAVSAADREHVRAVLESGGPFVSAALAAPSAGIDAPAVVIGVPTRDASGGVSGLLGNTITLEQLTGTLTAFEPGRRGVLLVVDRSDRLIVDTGRPAEGMDVSTAPVLKRARAESVGVVDSTTGLRGERGRLVAYAPAPSGNWVVLVDRSREEALGASRRQFQVWLAAIVAVTALGLGGAAWSARRLDRLAAQERRAAARTARLQEVTAALSEALLPEQVADVIIAQASEALDARAALVAIRGDDGRLEVARTSGYPPETVQSFSGIVGTVPLPLTDAIESRSLVLIESRAAAAERYPVLARARAAVTYQAWATVPFLIGGRALGAMDLSFAEPRHFDSDDQALLLAVGRQCAQALERARLYQSEQTARAEALEALRMRDEFLSTVSHDLRTPLASIKGYAQLVQRQLSRLSGIDTGRAVDSLGRIDASATRMSTMLGDLVDLARLQSGQPLQLNLEPTDLVALTRHAAAEAQAAAPERQIEVATAEQSLTGDWDAVRLERVLANLFSNAVKFSPDGGRVIASVSRIPGPSEDEPWAQFQVRDDGVGIPAADLPHIFERFHRGSNVSGRIAGSGIGLAGSKQIVEQHGGTITAESEEGRGTTVTVRLPM